MIFDRLSQNTLSATAKNFIGAKSLILPVILEVLQSKYENGIGFWNISMETMFTNICDAAGDKERHSNRIKGSLYLLRHRSILMPCLRDWRYIPTFALALCGTQHEDKVSAKKASRHVLTLYIAIHSRNDPQSFC